MKERRNKKKQSNKQTNNQIIKQVIQWNGRECEMGMDMDTWSRKGKHEQVDTQMEKLTAGIGRALKTKNTWTNLK
jgi:hypothetical protein